MASKVFKGDSEKDVDRLVEACQKQKQETVPLPGFGRELVPYFDAEQELASMANLQARLRNVQKSSSCGSPPRAASIKGNNHNNGTRTAQVSPQPSRQASMRLGDDTTPVSCPTKRDNNRSYGKKRTPITNGEAACPGVFASSPKPENLPIPTGLLNRAVTTTMTIQSVQSVVPTMLPSGVPTKLQSVVPTRLETGHRMQAIKGLNNINMYKIASPAAA